MPKIHIFYETERKHGVDMCLGVSAGCIIIGIYRIVSDQHLMSRPGISYFYWSTLSICKWIISSAIHTLHLFTEWSDGAKNPLELVFNAHIDFKSAWFPACPEYLSPQISGSSVSCLDMEKLIKVWVWYFGRFQRNFRKVILQLTLVIGGWSISCKIVLKWMPIDVTNGTSTLVEVMAWCRQATSQYLNQCWPRSMPPYGVTRP